MNTIKYPVSSIVFDSTWSGISDCQAASDTIAEVIKSVLTVSIVTATPDVDCDSTARRRRLTAGGMQIEIL